MRMAKRSRTQVRSDEEHIEERYRTIYDVVRAIPRGKIVTYGQVAKLAGMPGAARVAGAAMRSTPTGSGIPWQRVVGKKGKGLAKISILDPIGGAVQRQVLESEGVQFRDNGTISLAKYGWLPEDLP